MADDEWSDGLNRLIFTAVSQGLHEWTSFLLAYGADPNLTCSSRTPVGVLAHGGNTATLNVLLDHGACIQGKGFPTKCPLHCDADLVRHLLSCGTDANAATSSENGSALLVAASWDYEEIAQLLVDEGFADVDARDRMGRTPLMSSVNGRSLMRNPDAIFDLLLDTGADVNAVDHAQRTALHYAVCRIEIECVQALLLRGAHPNGISDIHGPTPMAALLTMTRNKVVRQTGAVLALLLSAGADPFVREPNGVTVAQMLERTASGRAFLRKHHQYFLSANASQ